MCHLDVLYHFELIVEHKVYTNSTTKCHSYHLLHRMYAYCLNHLTLSDFIQHLITHKRRTPHQFLLCKGQFSYIGSHTQKTLECYRTIDTQDTSSRNNKKRQLA